MPRTTRPEYESNHELRTLQFLLRSTAPMAESRNGWYIHSRSWPRSTWAMFSAPRCRGRPRTTSSTPPPRHYVCPLTVSGHMLHVSEPSFEKKPRDGRKLRMDIKPKNELAISRFMSRGGGFFGSGPDSSLADVGLQQLLPSNYTRPVRTHVHS